jgi:hypothetical protein
VHECPGRRKLHLALRAFVDFTQLQNNCVPSSYWRPSVPDAALILTRGSVLRSGASRPESLDLRIGADAASPRLPDRSTPRPTPRSSTSAVSSSFPGSLTQAPLPWCTCASAAGADRTAASYRDSSRGAPGKYGDRRKTGFRRCGCPLRRRRQEGSGNTKADAREADARIEPVAVG